MAEDEDTRSSERDEPKVLSREEDVEKEILQGSSSEPKSSSQEESNEENPDTSEKRRLRVSFADVGEEKPSEEEKPSVRLLGDTKNPSSTFEQRLNAILKEDGKPLVRLNDNRQSSVVSSRNCDMDDDDDDKIAAPKREYSTHRFALDIDLQDDNSEDDESSGNDSEQPSKVNDESQRTLKVRNDSERSSKVRIGNIGESQDDDDNKPIIDCGYDELSEEDEFSEEDEENDVEDPRKNTLQTGVLSRKRLRRRSLLMRMQDEVDDVLPPRASMLKSQRNFDDDFLSDDDDDFDDGVDNTLTSLKTVQTDFEQASTFAEINVTTPKRNKAATSFLYSSFRRFKHLPNMNKVLPKDIPDNTTKSFKLTKEEILQYSKEGLIDSSGCVTMTLGIFFLLLFGLVSIGIGYTIGQE